VGGSGDCPSRGSCCGRQQRETCASDLYRTGEICASDLYRTGEICASDLYRGEGEEGRPEAHLAHVADERRDCGGVRAALPHARRGVSLEEELSLSDGAAIILRETMVRRFPHQDPY
jgi:hypothetical protein